MLRITDIADQILFVQSGQLNCGVRTSMMECGVQTINKEEEFIEFDYFTFLC